MSEAVFLRLLSYEDKSVSLMDAIRAAQDGRTLNSIVHVVNPASFSQIPGSTFAYWVSESVRRIFTEFPPLESERRTVKQGLATADDFRFIRLWWEVKPGNRISGTLAKQFRQQTFLDKRWALFAKGGVYSPYYNDIHLLVNWERDGEEIKTRINPESGRPYSNVWQLKGTENNFFFCPGLTWPLRTQKGLRGCV